MIFDWTSFLIVSTVIACGMAGFGSVIVILRRKVNQESIFFSLFLIGLTLYVIFYFFLNIEILKYLHYPLSTIAIEMCVFGIFMFSYSLKNKGKALKKIAAIIIGPLTIPPLLCFLYMPFIFIHESYGYELQIEGWFLIVFTLVNIVFFIYASYYLIILRFQSYSLQIRKKIGIIIISLVIIAICGLIFLVIIPVTFQLHEIKPIGYLIISMSMIIMSYAFKKEED